MYFWRSSFWKEILARIPKCTVHIDVNTRTIEIPQGAPFLDQLITLHTYSNHRQFRDMVLIFSLCCAERPKIKSVA